MRSKRAHEARIEQPERAPVFFAGNTSIFHFRARDTTPDPSINILLPCPLENQNFYSGMILLASDWGQTMATISHCAGGMKVVEKQKRVRREKKRASHKFVNRLANPCGRGFIRFSCLSTTPTNSDNVLGKTLFP